jgi:hypothetical protein
MSVVLKSCAQAGAFELPLLEAEPFTDEVFADVVDDWAIAVPSGIREFLASAALFSAASPL